MKQFDDFNGTIEQKSVMDLIRQAHYVFSDQETMFSDRVSVIEEGGLGRVFAKKIYEEIAGKSLSENDLFLCGLYVANLLSELTSRIPHSWWAIDYITHLNDPSVVKKGADVCFTICGVFPERGNYRRMKLAYYQKAGAGLYYQLYLLTRREIGLHMSNQFATMSQLVRQCLQKL